MYTALVLDENDQIVLIDTLIALVPNDWEIIAHHMTINMGPAANEAIRDLLGTFGYVKVIKWGISDKAIAVQVESNTHSDNAIKHITIAVNRANGGKPFHSNQITEWYDIPEDDQICLIGRIEECK